MSDQAVEPIFEVFRQTKAGDPFIHVGAVTAPDEETALLVAKEHFARRESCRELWVVGRQHILKSWWDVEVFQAGRDKRYRQTAGMAHDRPSKQEQPDG